MTPLEELRAAMPAEGWEMVYHDERHYNPGGHFAFHKASGIRVHIHLGWFSALYREWMWLDCQMAFSTADEVFERLKKWATKRAPAIQALADSI